MCPSLRLAGVRVSFENIRLGNSHGPAKWFSSWWSVIQSASPQKPKAPRFPRQSSYKGNDNRFAGDDGHSRLVWQGQVGLRMQASWPTPKRKMSVALFRIPVDLRPAGPPISPRSNSTTRPRSRGRSRPDAGGRYRGGTPRVGKTDLLAIMMQNLKTCSRRGASSRATSRTSRSARSAARSRTSATVRARSRA
ncbi:hypothetical protein VTO42DRAFT_8714 [Malbranchea cinnamomea]